MSPDFKDLLQCFNDENVEYMVVGGYAVMAYTEPRYTKDLDLWIRAEPENARRAFRALAKFGAPLDQVSVDDFACEGNVFQIGLAPVRADILMSISGLTFDAAWPNKQRQDFGGITAWVISRADLIRNKRSSARPQDLLDVANLEAADD
ncbi:MAG: hypothetical protein HY319_10350 [Armatimonadetes bacterium]|nr:hypothetical protein [Armatimonadota bacterium]